MNWPEDDKWIDVHNRLLDGDPVAPSDVALMYLDLLVEFVERTNPKVDAHICATAAEDALLSFIKSPSRYDPAKLDLTRYLKMSAQGDLRNALRSEQRHSSRRSSLEDVELSAGVGNSSIESLDPAQFVETKESIAERSEAQRLTAKMGGNFSATDIQVLDLIRQGERRTSTFSAVLGIEALSPDEQRAEVKRVKDRLNRRLNRARK